MKYIKSLKTIEDYKKFKYSDEAEYPNVSLIEDYNAIAFKDSGPIFNSVDFTIAGNSATRLPDLSKFSNCKSLIVNGNEIIDKFVNKDKTINCEIGADSYGPTSNSFPHIDSCKIVLDEALGENDAITIFMYQGAEYIEFSVPLLMQEFSMYFTKISNTEFLLSNLMVYQLINPVMAANSGKITFVGVKEGGYEIGSVITDYTKIIGTTIKPYNKTDIRFVYDENTGIAESSYLTETLDVFQYDENFRILLSESLADTDYMGLFMTDGFDYVFSAMPKNSAEFSQLFSQISDIEYSISPDLISQLNTMLNENDVNCTFFGLKEGTYTNELTDISNVIQSTLKISDTTSFNVEFEPKTYGILSSSYTNQYEYLNSLSLRFDRELTDADNIYIEYINTSGAITTTKYNISNFTKIENENVYILNDDILNTINSDIKSDGYRYTFYVLNNDVCDCPIINYNYTDLTFDGAIIPGTTESNVHAEFNYDYEIADIFKGNINLRSVIIPDNMEFISPNMFNGCTSLKSVTIPKSVKIISYNAFLNCNSLNAVYIEDINAWCDVKIASDVKSGPLYYAKNLYLNGELVTDLVIPDGVNEIKFGTFYGCTSLKSLKINSKLISRSAFNNCTSLTSVTIGNSVTSIGDYAFSGCSSLTSIVIPDSVTSIGGSAFTACSSLTSVTIGNSVTSIGDYAFQSCSSLTSITIPDSVTSIGGSAFSACSSLTSVTIGNSVTSIGQNTFYNCSSLTSVVIPDSVTSIGGDAFGDCLSLTSVTIGNSVTSIGDYAFYCCRSLTSVVIPDSVTSIGGDAFQYCTSLTSVTIGNSVTSIGTDAFRNCSSLTSVHISDISSWCNISFNNEYSNPLYYAKNLYLNGELVTDLVIPDSVTSIGKRAFYNCSSLTSVTIPNSVISIGSYAFYGCPSLTSVHISDISSWCNISFNNEYSNPLYYAKNLYLNGELVTDLVIPDSVTSIGGDAFQYCTSLTSVTIGNSVTSIGTDAFSGCSSLTSIVIPDSVTSIGGSAFRNCSSLTSVHISDISSWCNISFNNEYSNPLYYAKNLYLNGELVTDLVIPDSVTSIGKRAFYNCSSLTSVTIGNSVTSIGTDAFYKCSSLTSVVIPDSVTSIGERAFYNCSSLTSVTIGNSVTSIGGSAFRNCSSLTSVTIPNSVTSIGSYAFQSCSSLTSITIPDSVTSIGSGAFNGCVNIITIENGLRYVNNILIKCDTNVTEANIKEGTRIIADSAFSDCSSLTSVTIGNSVTSIGERVFYECSSLTSIVIPDSVTSIGGGAFNGCTSLTSVTIGNSVTSIGDYAFYGCRSLTSVVIPDSVTSIGDYAFSGCSSLTSIVIPDSVTSIGTDAFYNCSSLTSVVIPDSVTSIGSYAFYGCPSLTSVVIPDSVTSIGGDAFGDCSSLTSVTIGNSVTSIGDRAFCDCSSLTSVTIGNSVTSIGDYAFYKCSSLTSVHISDISSWCNISFNNDYSNPLYYAKNLYLNGELVTDLVIPDSVTSIGGDAFQYCTSLTSVTIGNSVTSIGDYAFYGCRSLTSVTIGNSVTSIGDYAFYGCRSLTSVHISDISSWCNISFNNEYSNPLYYAKNLYLNGELVTDLVIPDSVTSIGSYAFYKCKSLKSVKFLGSNKKTVAASAFENCSFLNFIYNECPISYYWSSFNNIKMNGTVIPRNDIPEIFKCMFWDSIKI